MDLMNAGARVIVEKPIALSLEDEDAMIEMAAERVMRHCIDMRSM